MDIDEDHRFSIADYVLFAITIFISLAIGLFYAFSGGHQRTTAEFFVGNRHMKFIPVTISLLVSFESSIMMLGYPAEGYVYGIMFWIRLFGALASNLLATRIAVVLFHPLKLTSVYEYFELRYKGRSVRLLGTVLGTLSYLFYIGIVLYGPGLALEAVTDLPMWLTVSVVALVAVIYTAIGGLKAVVWTDVFQFAVMFSGILAIIIKGTIESGGPRRVLEINHNAGRLNFFNFDPDPTVRHTFWSLIVGTFIGTFSVAFNQSSVQRISATRTIKDAKRMWWIAAPMFTITLSLTCFEGIVAFAFYYTKRCDPIASGRIRNANQIVPYMVMDVFKNLPGMPGLFIASLFSATLSTLSSGLSSLSALTLEDIIKPYMSNLSDMKATFIAKTLVVVYGLLAMAISFMIATIPGPLTQIAYCLLSAFAGPLCGLFLFSIFCPWANPKGCLFGGISSFCFILWIAFGQTFSKTLIKTPWLPLAPTDNCPESNTTSQELWNNTTLINIAASNTSYANDLTPFKITQQGVDKLYSLSYLWLGPVGILWTIVIGTIASIATGLPKSSDVDPKYILPFFDQLCCFIPSSIRKFMRCGIKYEMVHRNDHSLDEREMFEQTYPNPSDRHELDDTVEHNVEIKGP